MQKAQALREQQFEEQQRAQQAEEELARQKAEFQRRKFAADVMGSVLPLLQGTPQQRQIAKSMLGLGGITPMQGEDYVPREDTGDLGRDADAAVGDAMMTLDAAQGRAEGTTPGEGPVPRSAMPEEMQRRRAEEQRQAANGGQGVQPRRYAEEHVLDPRTGEPLTSEADARAIREGKQPVVDPDVMTSRPVIEGSVEDKELDPTVMTFELGEVERAWEEEVRPQLETPEGASEVRMDEQVVEGRPPRQRADSARPSPGMTQSPMLAQATPQRRAQSGAQQQQSGAPMRFMYGGQPLPGVFDAQAMQQRKEGALFGFFDDLLRTEGMRGKPAAQQARALTRRALDITNGNTAAATKLISDYFQKRRGRESAMARQRIGARAATQARGTLGTDERLMSNKVWREMRQSQSDMGTPEAVENLRTARQALDKLKLREGATDQEVYMALIRLQQNSGRLSDKDVKIGPAMKSVFENLEMIKSQALEGRLSDSMRSKVTTALKKHEEHMKSVLENNLSRANRYQKGYRPGSAAWRSAERFKRTYFEGYQSGGGREGRSQQARGGRRQSGGTVTVRVTKDGRTVEGAVPRGKLEALRKEAQDSNMQVEVVE